MKTQLIYEICYGTCTALVFPLLCLLGDNRPVWLSPPPHRIVLFRERKLKLALMLFCLILMRIIGYWMYPLSDLSGSAHVALLCLWTTLWSCCPLPLSILLFCSFTARFYGLWCREGIFREISGHHHCEIAIVLHENWG